MATKEHSAAQQAASKVVELAKAEVVPTPTEVRDAESDLERTLAQSKAIANLLLGGIQDCPDPEATMANAAWAIANLMDEATEAYAVIARALFEARSAEAAVAGSRS